MKQEAPTSSRRLSGGSSSLFVGDKDEVLDYEFIADNN
jgi:hypothetical protein